MKIFEYENMFKQSLKDGIALFCGAGFSVESKDKSGKKLPVGTQLLSELKDGFPDISAYTNLPRACTKLEKSGKEMFYNYLENRFEIADYNVLYNELLKIKINSIYTTNIDDLFFKIYDNDQTLYYLNDCSIKGREFDEKFAIPYYALHGCIRAKNRGYVFGVTEIASAFSERSKEDAWRNLTKEVSNKPVLFWGWNFSDSGPIEAMYGEGSNIDNNIYRWVLLYEENEEIIDFLHTLKFNIIVGSTLELLEYIKKYNDEQKDVIVEKPKGNNSQLFKQYVIPANDDSLVSYRFEEYFTKSSPRWSYVYLHQIYKTVHYKNIVDLISTKKDIIVIGIRSSGKTTLMMQLLVDYQTSMMKHYMVSPSLEQVNNYLKKLNCNRSLIFVDDCLRDTEAMIRLLDSKNVQVIGFERDFNYEGQYHRLKNHQFELIEVTEICKEDAQGIIESIPRNLKKRNASTRKFEKDPTILNLLACNLKPVSFNFIRDFYNKDNVSAKLFLMTCYVHSCGVPCSFDMVYSFLGDENYNWQEMLEAVDKVGGLINECSDLFGSSDIMAQFEDYYQCRSRILAENIITKSSKVDKYLKEVIKDFAESVPVYKICNYDKFKRSAYDANLISQVFKDITEGEEFYLLCAKKDGSEYLHQQAALYFFKAGQHKKAFEWIDRARNIAHYNRFTVDSTYAQIYFEVNLTASETETYNALRILEKCCRDDKRRSIHFLIYAQSVIKFCNQYGQSDNREYLLSNALEFLEEGLSETNKSLSNKMKWKLKDARKELKCFL